MGPTLDESFGWYEKDNNKLQAMIKTYREINEVNHNWLVLKIVLINAKHVLSNRCCVVQAYTFVLNLEQNGGV